jgi:hypothetical protein
MKINRKYHPITFNECIDCRGLFTVRVANANRAERCRYCGPGHTKKRRKEREKSETFKASRKSYWIKNKGKYQGEYNNERHRKETEQLADVYVRRHVIRDYGIPYEFVTKEMIELKRQAMLAGRMVRKLWKEDRDGARF